MTLQLPPHIERRLVREAAEHGLKPDDYAARLLDKELKPDPSVPRQDPLARPRPQFGSAKGLLTVPPDFDEPLEDFAEYMP